MPEADLPALMALEAALHRPEVRRDAAKVARLLHEDFTEFGRSGRRYDKAQILALLAQDDGAGPPQADGYRVQRLAPGVALLTYRTRREAGGGGVPICSLRSSVWQWQDGRWQMLFHQGTPTEPFEVKPA